VENQKFAGKQTDTQQQQQQQEHEILWLMYKRNCAVGPPATSAQEHFTVAEKRAGKPCH
jgi:hypothetical protein